MKLKLKLIALLSFVIGSLNAQISHQMIAVDKDDLLRKVVMKTENKTATLMVITSKKTNKKIKFTPYLVVLERAAKISQTAIELKAVEGNEEAEERVITLQKISQDRILLITMSDNKKENSIVLRLFSNNGDLLNEHLLSTKSERGFMGSQVADNQLVICHREFEGKENIYTRFDKDLKPDKSIRYSGKDDTHIPNGGFMYKNNSLYVLYSRKIQGDADLSKPQFSVYRVDFESGKEVNEAHFINDKYFSNLRFFNTPEALEMISVVSPSFSKRSTMSVVASIQMNWENMKFSTIFSELDLMKALTVNAIFPAGAGSAINQYSFHVIREPNAGYTILARSAVETSRTISEFQQGGGFKTYEYYTAFFHDGLIFCLDSQLQQTVKDEVTIVKNGFVTAGKNSHMYLFKDPLTDFYQPYFSSDTSKHLLLNVSGINEGTYKLSVQIKQNGKYKPDPAYEINPDLKINSFFYPKTIEEMSPGVFVIKAYLRGKGDRLLIIITR